MRATRRGSAPPPASLEARNRAGTTELERARAHMSAPLGAGQDRSAFPFAAYKADDVKERLEALFHGKCAYCESLYASQAPVDVEHFRPKGAVQDDPSHGGYWWIAMQWENLLPSCIDCNRRRRQGTPAAVSDLRVLYEVMQSGKADAFPILGARATAEATDFSSERALLLDPTRDDPEAHLAFELRPGIAEGLVYPKATGVQPADPLPALSQDHQTVAAAAAAAGLSVRAAVSIQVYGLNRLRLVQERAAVIRRLRFLGSVLVELGRIAAAIDKPVITGAYPEVGEAIRGLRILQGQILAEMTKAAAPEAAFSATASAFLRDFRKRVA